MGSLIFALVAFVGSHFLLSHPLRRSVTQAIGRRGFLGVYSLISAATLAWAIVAYSKAPTVFLWTPPAFLYPLTAVVMLAALILFLGSLIQPNPMLLQPASVHSEVLAPPRLPKGPMGVVAITRHPMMWGIGLWAISHALVNGDAATVLLCLGVAILALGGAAMQDRRRATEIGPEWQDFVSSTAYVPFAAQFAGRLRWRTIWPGWLVVVGGVSLFVALVFFHETLFGVPALRG